MAFTFGFYNSYQGDRKYDAEDVNKILDGLVNYGVYASVGKIFAVTPGTGMQVLIDTGRAWLNRTWNENDAIMSLRIPTADMTLSRIYAVVIEINSHQDVRTNSIKLVPGLLATAPERPAMIKSETLNQWALAYVTVGPRVTEIRQSDIVVVVGMSETPFVTGIIQTARLDALFQKWEGDFIGWLESLQDILDDNVAGNLLNLINKAENRLDALTPLRDNGVYAEPAPNPDRNIIVQLKDIRPGSVLSVLESGNLVGYSVIQHGYDREDPYAHRTLVMRNQALPSLTASPLNSGNLTYEGSPLDQLLNSTAGEGYLARLDPELRAHIAEIPIWVLPKTSATTFGASKRISRRVFIPSATELGFVPPVVPAVENGEVFGFRRAPLTPTPTRTPGATAGSILQSNDGTAVTTLNLASAPCFTLPADMEWYFNGGDYSLEPGTAGVSHQLYHIQGEKLTAERTRWQHISYTGDGAWSERFARRFDTFGWPLMAIIWEESSGSVPNSSVYHFHREHKSGYNFASPQQTIPENVEWGTNFIKFWGTSSAANGANVEGRAYTAVVLIETSVAPSVVRNRVVDDWQQPVAGVEILGLLAPTVTDANGWFEGEAIMPAITLTGYYNHDTTRRALTSITPGQDILYPVRVREGWYMATTSGEIKWSRSHIIDACLISGGMGGVGGAGGPRGGTINDGSCGSGTGIWNVSPSSEWPNPSFGAGDGRPGASSPPGNRPFVRNLTNLLSSNNTFQLTIGLGGQHSIINANGVVYSSENGSQLTIPMNDASFLPIQPARTEAGTQGAPGANGFIAGDWGENIWNGMWRGGRGGQGGSGLATGFGGYGNTATLTDSFGNMAADIITTVTGGTGGAPGGIGSPAIVNWWAPAVYGATAGGQGGSGGSDGVGFGAGGGGSGGGGAGATNDCTWGPLGENGNPGRRGGNQGGIFFKFRRR